MDFDENYLDELLKSIEPITGPAEEDAELSESDESVPDVPEEELDSDVAEPLDADPEPEPEPEPEQVEEVQPVEEPVAESPAVSLDVDPEDGNKTLSPEEIAAMFNAAGSDETLTSAEEPVDADEPLEIDMDDPELASLLSEVESDEDGADEAEASGAGEADGLSLDDLMDGSSDDTVSLESLLDESESDDDQGSSEPVEVDLSDDDTILENLMGEGPSLSDLLDEDGDGAAEADEEQALSADEIDAMLEAAQNAGSEEDDLTASDVGDTDELMSLLASAGDEDLGDIQNLLDSDENGEAVDESALLAATTVDDVAAGVLDTPEEAAARAKEEKKAAKLKAKADKKAAKAAKKAGKGGGTDGAEASEGEEPKQGFFAKLFGMLTETVDEEEGGGEAAAEGAEGGESGESSEVANISDENKEIMEELDKEQGKKKGKKKKKKKKGKDAEGEGEEGEGAEGEEGEGEGGKKKKKKERKKKEKAPKAEEVPAKPEKKLPKKRVRATFILCLSILAGIVIITLVFTKVHNLEEAREAYDKQDYQTTYEDLYGLKLKDDDEEIFVKSQIMLMLDRKYKSYQNYMKLGMEDRAVNALLEGVGMYPDILVQAESYGVVPQVEYTYSQILDALSAYGLSEEDAKEIVAYDSKVKYTKRIDSLVHGTPFTYDDDIAAEDRAAGAGAEAEPSDAENRPEVEDILPPETDFLPDDPAGIFSDDEPDAAPEGTPDEGEMPDMDTDEGNV